MHAEHVAVLIGLGLALASHPSAAQVIQQNLWVTDGTVNAVAFGDSEVYLGGSFTQVGPPIGAAAALDPTTGAVLNPWPQVTGTVNTVVSDGGGGWYIGGQFTHVQGQARTSLAHLDGRGNLTSWSPTPAWAPGLVPIVYSLVLSGSTVYVGGDFYTMNGQVRNFLAAVDTTSGAVTGWDPEPDDVVNALAMFGTTVYVAGTFSGVGGQLRSGLAALDTTGLATGWNPGVSGGSVRALAVSGLISYPFTISVWAGGSFTFIGGQSRNGIAVIDGNTGAAMSWNPNANGQVTSLGLHRGVLGQVTTIYAGGAFTNIGGAARNYIAALDGTGAATSWDPSANAPVECLTLAGGPIVVGGDFTVVGGQNRAYLAQLDATTGAATSWNPNPNHAVEAVAYDGTETFAGGTFTSLGGVPRTNLAALRRYDGSATPWSPYVGGPVDAIAASGSTIYIGGDFFNVGGVLHAHIAAVDSATGLPTAWDPTTDSAVLTMALYGNTVFVGGGFSNVSGATRYGLGAIDLTTGAATSWDPGVTSNSCETCPATVNALALSAQIHLPFTVTVWVGGTFQDVGYYPSLTARNYLAAIDASSGAPTSWNPDADGIVRAIAPRFGKLGDVTSIYAGGSFLNVDGQSRARIADIDLTGTPTSWAPNADGPVNALGVTGGAIYAGGEFTNIGGAPRYTLAALDPTSGAATAWDAALEGGILTPVYTLGISGGLLYEGGGFLDAMGWPHASIAALSEAATGAGVGAPSPAAAAGVLLAAPNPFHGRVSLRFTLPVSQSVQVAVYDVSGRRVRTLHSGALGAGAQDLEWDGRTDAGQQARSGIYFARVESAGMSFSGRMLKIE